jgi:hypothetical protein
MERNLCRRLENWIPACAGMTVGREFSAPVIPAHAGIQRDF